MFNQVFVEQGERRPWTLAVSFGLQCIFIGALILIPLVYTEAGPRLLSFTPIIEPPPGRDPAPVPRVQRTAPVKAPQSELRAGQLIAPTRIPNEVSMISDPGPPPAPFSGDPNGVSGGTGGSWASSLTMNLIGPKPAVPTPPAPKPSPVRYVVGGSVQQALAISQPMPLYPETARRARISGVVRLSATITETGTIERLRVLEGHPLLVQAALEAVMQWRYRPTILNGVPVMVDTTIEVHFKLDR